MCRDSPERPRTRGTEDEIRPIQHRASLTAHPRARLSISWRACGAACGAWAPGGANRAVMGGGGRADALALCDLWATPDHGISGAKGRDKRPQFDTLCKAAARREFDVVMAWSVDRLGRSLQDLVGFLSELHALGIDLFLHQQGVDTTTPSGKAMFQMMGVADRRPRSRGCQRARTNRPRGRARLRFGCSHEAR
jgi:hypothetical protein